MSLLYHKEESKWHMVSLKNKTKKPWQLMFTWDQPNPTPAVVTISKRETTGQLTMDYWYHWDTRCLWVGLHSKVTSSGGNCRNGDISVSLWKKKVVSCHTIWLHIVWNLMLPISPSLILYGHVMSLVQSELISWSLVNISQLGVCNRYPFKGFSYH